MGIKFSNNASANIIRAITPTATSVSVTVGKGDLFPSLTEGDYFYATLAGNNGLEIVKVTNRINDTMTIVRAQDNTTALSFDTGDLFELRIVAADFNDTFSEINNKLEASIEETTSKVNSALSSKAPFLHASPSTEYGAGSSEQYGHLKSNDSPDYTKTADKGHAFSPAGAAAILDSLEGQIGDLAGVVSGNASTQAAKDAEQDAAITGKLNKNGDLLNGAIESAVSVALKRSVDTDGLVICGGTDISKNSFLLLNGGNKSVGTAVVQLNPRKNDGTTAYFNFYPNGDINFNGHTIFNSTGVNLKKSIIVEDAFSARPIIVTSSNYTVGVTPSVNQEKQIGFNDSQNNTVGMVGHMAYATGEVQTRLRCWAATDTNNYTTLQLGFNKNGKKFAKIDDNALITLASSWHDDNGNWYRKWSDGWIEQGGHMVNASTTNDTTTLHVPYSNTNYTLVGYKGQYSSAYANFEWVEKTTTSFTTRGASNAPIGGDWYACGY